MCERSHCATRLGVLDYVTEIIPITEEGTMTKLIRTGLLALTLALGLVPTLFASARAGIFEIEDYSFDVEQVLSFGR